MSNASLPDQVTDAPATGRIQPGSGVRLHFSLALTGGEVIDSNFDGSPVEFRIGDGNMLPGFETVLIGHGAGDFIERTIAAAEAFGLPNPQNRQVFPIAKFRQLVDDELIAAKAGTVVAFRDQGGFELPGVITAVGNATVSVDFNHPLAGRNIVFKAQILSVLEPEQQVVGIKL